MARRELAERYLGQLFGAAWAVAQPLTFIGIYVVIFGMVFSGRAATAGGGTSHYVSYLLAGLIPWMLVQEVMGKTTTAITANTNLVKQVVFPIEILPAKTVLASLISHIPYFALVLVYSATLGAGLKPLALLLPVVLTIQAVAMLGIGYGVSAVGVYFRDIRELVALFGRVGVYLAPIVFVPQMVPKLLQPILWLNPFSHLVWCWQDILFAGAIEHPWSWLVIVILSLLTLAVGHRVFSKLQPHFGSVL
jgi:lipopolysaccharide transport system permease protein